MARSTRSGYSLTELMVVMAILGFLAVTGITALMNAMCRGSLRAAAARVQGLLRETREDAIALQRNRGIRFTRDGRRWFWAVYDDGDGDGVRNADIDTGIDLLAYGPEDLGTFSGMATIGIPEEGVSHPDDGTKLPAVAAPVRFNSSSICSFAADGSSTPGSVYLCDVNGGAAIVRSSGDGGRIRVMFYDRGGDRWYLQ